MGDTRIFLVHELPGRFRLRLEHRPEENSWPALRHNLADYHGVREVRTSRRTGSVLVIYDPEKTFLKEILALFQNRDIFLRQVPEPDSLHHEGHGSAETGQVTLSVAAGNGLNSVSPFSLALYADDLEDDLKDINGRNRDYLLEAWYKRIFMFSDHMKPAITGGIIDSTGYIDDNAFANDEVAQFMNDIFVNSTLANLPSYDIGGAAELEIRDFSVRTVVMNSRNEEDNNYNYYALQLGCSPDTPLGEGNYRVFGYTTGSEFENWD